MSGGVDSAVAALCLIRAGFDVHGLHMTNWQEDDVFCPAADDYQAAKSACIELGIPMHRVDFSHEYREHVFRQFLREYEAGRTPNPDVLCNRHIKFGCFLEYARRLGADRIATGHYARLSSHSGLRLLTATDKTKDQTYFLHAVPAESLTRSIFPLGDFSKAQVRDMANQAGLPNHDRRDSTGICFIGERPFREFLARYLDAVPGPMLTVEGIEVGRHVGLAFYTLGQRSGLGIGGLPDAAQAPWYVAGKDRERNALLVVQGHQHPLLWSSTLETDAAGWITAGPAGLNGDSSWRCEARIRHRHVPASCSVRQLADGGLEIRFDEPQWAPAPGQYAVFYEGEHCLGGAMIRSVKHRMVVSQRSTSAPRATRDTRATQVGPLPL